jgi:predicted lipoprotein with Yx(FWY)xxD motif
MVAVKTRHVAKFGEVLTNSAGRTLYVFTEDKKDKSECNGGCASAWPPVTVPSGATVSGMTGLTTITRKDGSEQAALNGRPLYTFAGDKAAGQTHGQGDDGDWFVVTTKGVSHVDAGSKKDGDDGDDDEDSDSNSSSSSTSSNSSSSSVAAAPTKSSAPSGGGYGY